MIVDPWAKIIATTEEKEDLVLADVDLSLGRKREREEREIRTYPERERKQRGKEIH